MPLAALSVEDESLYKISHAGGVLVGEVPRGGDQQSRDGFCCLIQRTWGVTVCVRMIQGRCMAQIALGRNQHFVISHI